MIGAKIVGDLIKITNPKDIDSPNELSLQKFTNLLEQSTNVVDEDCHPDQDHRKEDNPYKSKFGRNWKHQMKKSVTFSHSVGICNDIKHVTEESKMLIKGTFMKIHGWCITIPCHH